jgi:hypothetical protein
MENFAMMAAVTRPPTLAAKTNPLNPINWQVLSSMLYYCSLGNKIRKCSRGRYPDSKVACSKPSRGGHSFLHAFRYIYIYIYLKEGSKYRVESSIKVYFNPENFN